MRQGGGAKGCVAKAVPAMREMNAIVVAAVRNIGSVPPTPGRGKNRTMHFQATSGVPGLAASPMQDGLAE